MTLPPDPAGHRRPRSWKEAREATGGYVAWPDGWRSASFKPLGLSTSTGVYATLTSGSGGIAVKKLDGLRIPGEAPKDMRRHG